MSHGMCYSYCRNGFCNSSIKNPLRTPLHKQSKVEIFPLVELLEQSFYTNFSFGHHKDRDQMKYNKITIKEFFDLWLRLRFSAKDKSLQKLNIWLRSNVENATSVDTWTALASFTFFEWKFHQNLTLCSRVVCTVVKKAALSEIKRLSLNEGKQYIFNSVCKEFKPSVQRLKYLLDI